MSKDNNYQTVLNYIQKTLHIASMLIPTTYTVARNLSIEEDEVIAIYELLEREGLIVDHSSYLYEISPLFPLTTEIKDRIRKYELKTTTTGTF